MYSGLNAFFQLKMPTEIQCCIFLLLAFLLDHFVAGQTSAIANHHFAANNAIAPHRWKVPFVSRLPSRLYAQKRDPSPSSTTKDPDWNWNPIQDFVRNTKQSMFFEDLNPQHLFQQKIYHHDFEDQKRWATRMSENLPSSIYFELTIGRLSTKSVFVKTFVCADEFVLVNPFQTPQSIGQNCFFIDKYMLEHVKGSMPDSCALALGINDVLLAIRKRVGIADLDPFTPRTKELASLLTQNHRFVVVYQLEGKDVFIHWSPSFRFKPNPQKDDTYSKMVLVPLANQKIELPWLLSKFHQQNPTGQNRLINAIQGKEGAATMRELMSIAPIDPLALVHACMANDPDSVLMLLETGRVRLDAHDWNGPTALTYSCRMGYLGIVEMLFDFGASDQNGSALLAAVENRHISVVRLLLERGANANQRVKYHYTPLQMAMKNGQTEVIQLLINYGAKL